MKGTAYCGYCINQIGTWVREFQNGNLNSSEVEKIVEASIFNYNKERPNMTNTEKIEYDSILKSSLIRLPQETRINLTKLIGAMD